MMKRIFALASVSALGGLVTVAAAAGCSSSEEKEAPPADAGADVKRVREAGPAAPGDAGEEEKPSCMTTNAIDATQFPYSKPVQTPDACTNDELKAISSYFASKSSAGEDALVSDWQKQVSGKCAKCVFGAADAAEWAPILVKEDKLDNVNRGGCIEIMSGKPACGKIYQQATECRLQACLEKCTTQDEFTACLQDTNAIFSGPCKASYDSLTKECGNNLGSYENACKGTAWTFEGPIKAQCITSGKADAGDGG